MDLCGWIKIQPLFFCKKTSIDSIILSDNGSFHKRPAAFGSETILA